MAEDAHDWQAIIADDLKEASVIMRSATRDDYAEIQEILDYSLDSPGKMVRPSILILTARAVGSDATKQVLDYAAAVELVHMATLVHDDINDESDSRRGQPSVHNKYGIRKALTIGDIMLNRAMGLFSYDPALVDTFINMGSALADSEFLQYNHRFDMNITEPEYYQIISGKTAMFLSRCAKIGSIAAGADNKVVEEMERYGQLYGMAFQIADDLIDLTGTQEVSGKTAMRDLSEGVFTLPTILAIHDPKLGNKIRSKIKRGASLDEIRDLITQTGAIDECKAIINDYVEEAVDCLSILPESPYKQSLTQLARLNSTRIS